MKISPSWLRDFVDLPVDYRRLADELTLAGVAVEGISGEGESTVYEMEITTNRPDAMNHYGVAREASALYDLPLKPIEPKLPAPQGKSEVTDRYSGAGSLPPLYGARNSRRTNQAIAGARLPIALRSSISVLSATPSTPPTMFSGRAASRPTCSISTCSKVVA